MELNSCIHCLENIFLIVDQDQIECLSALARENLADQDR